MPVYLAALLNIGRLAWPAFKGHLAMVAETERLLVQFSAYTADKEQLKLLKAAVKDIARTTVVSEYEVLTMVEFRWPPGDDLEPVIRAVRLICELRTKGYLYRKLD